MYFYPSFRRQHYILQLTHVRLFPSCMLRATISLLILSSPSCEPPAYCRDYTRVEFVWHSTEREEEKRKIKTFHNPLKKKVISLKLNLHCVLARILSLYMRLRQDTEKSATISWWCCTIKFNFNPEIPSPPHPPETSVRFALINFYSLPKWRQQQQSRHE